MPEAPNPPAHDRAEGRLAGEGNDLRPLVELAAFVLGFAVYVYVVGFIANWLQLAAARLPVEIVSSYSNTRIVGDGLRSTALSGVTFAVLCLLAYVLSWHRWGVNGSEWRAIVEQRGVRRAKDSTSAEDRARRLDAEKQHNRTVLKELAASAGRTVARRPSPPAAPASAGRRAASAAEEERSTDVGLRVVAGFNMIMIAALLATALAVGLDELFGSLPGWLTGILWGLAFFGVFELLTRLGPLRFGARIQGVFWLLVACAALFASAPLGLIVLVGVLSSTLGRALARQRGSGSKRGSHERPTRTGARGAGQLRAWIESPVPWALFALVALLGFAYQAIPPVAFPGAILTTTAGSEQTGGYLTRSNGGVLLAACHQRVDATSSEERVVFAPSGSVKAITLGGRPQVFDTGQRSSLVALAQKALGLNQTAPTLISADLRPRRATCLGGAKPAQERGAEGGLGANVLEDPHPHDPPRAAQDGEQPIENAQGTASKTPKSIAELALKYQPTVELSVADRNWPVSVKSLLSARGPGGVTSTCLRQKRAPTTACPPTLAQLTPQESQRGDYLQYPVKLKDQTSPTAQFEAFERGQGVKLPSVETWLANPATLQPWSTAQLYFFYAGALSPSLWPKRARDPRLPERLETLEYWFFYPYNYFPLVVHSNLMQDAPIAAEVRNLDFHQGDWEHIDVLLDPKTHIPLWLYAARHSDEGQFVPWGAAPMVLEDTHPVIRPAYGGHPSYPPDCGPQRRAKTAKLLNDWLVCGPQFAFRAPSTPLVDLAWTPWACWRGHFGEAELSVEVKNANEPESVLDELERSQVLVAGPPSPLLQAENSGVCEKGKAEGSKLGRSENEPAFPELQPGG
jgi:hypothetical protein